MRAFISQFFTWWNGTTLGTRLHTWWRGDLVGQDEFGNRYYRYRGEVDPVLGFDRRWVIYNGEAEASFIPPAWHAWIHHIVDAPPSEESYTPREWERPHRANLTGTPAAYRPPGSVLTPRRRRRVTGDYDAWSPDG